MDRFNEKTYFLETYGCSANVSDSNKLIKQLESEHWKRVYHPNEAELSLINTCGVKDPTEIKILKSLKKISQIESTMLVITGCLPAISYNNIKKAVPKFGAIFDTKSTHLFKNILFRLQNGEQNIEIFSTKKEAQNKIDILPVLNTPNIGIITVNEGCDGNCSFCGTKLARGSTIPFDSDKLVKQADYFLSNGAKILWVTSQDTGAYYWQSNKEYVELPELLDKICSLPYRFRLRIGMINPDHALRLEDRLIDVFNEYPQIFHFLHIPVQSGNDRILNLMKRRYTSQEFELIVQSFRRSFPDVTISTDVIVGFPGETDLEFQDTLNLVDRINPDILNISRYGARPGTLAAKMPEQILDRIKKDRSRVLTKLWQKNLEKSNEKWVNWHGKVIIEEEGIKNNQEGSRTYVARNQSYRPIILSEDNFSEEPLGKFYKASVVQSNAYYLVGKVV